MMGYRYLVLGAGMGKAIAHNLACQPDTEIITINDQDGKKLLGVVQELEKIKAPSTEIHALISPIEQLDTSSLLSGFDVLISALPAKFNLKLAQAAIKANVNFCDLGGVVDVAQKILDLKNTHTSLDKSIITGCGIMPGTGEILAQMLINKFDHATHASILVGGIPQKPKPPTFYSLPFSPIGLEHLCFDKTPVLEDGQIVWSNPFSKYERMVIPELAKFSDRFKGEVEIFITAGTSHSPWEFQRQGVVEYSERTIRWPGFVESFGNISRDKFREKVSHQLDKPNKENPDLVYLKVLVSGYSSTVFKHRSISLLDLFDEATELTAMERTTGFSTAIIASMMAHKQTRTGINTPESCMSEKGLSDFSTELKKYFKITEK